MDRRSRARAGYAGYLRERRRRAASGGSSDARAALFVFPGDFELRGMTIDEEDGDSWEPVEDEAEAQYLIAGARLVWKNRQEHASLFDPEHRITVAITNLIQSTSAVIDLVSGEITEVTGFYPNGAREHWLTASAFGGTGHAEIPLEPVGFTGKEADEEVGLTYFGERYLVARIGRWATPDPLSVHAAGGGEALNAFHYVSGNLLQVWDPLGLEPPPNPFVVPEKTLLTRLREGNSERTLSPHRPNSGASGVTIGYGYDVGSRTQKGVQRHLQAAGFEQSKIDSMKAASGLKGDEAKTHFDEKKATDLNWSINETQRADLLKEVFPAYENRARNLATSGEHAMTPEDYDAMHPAVRELLADLSYVGAPYSALEKHGNTRDAVNKILTAPGATDVSRLKGLRDHVQSLPVSQQKENGRQLRTQFIDATLEQLEPPEAPAVAGSATGAAHSSAPQPSVAGKENPE